VCKRARASSFVVIGLPRELCIYTQVVRLSLKCGCGITIDKKLMSVCRLGDENKSKTLYKQISATFFLLHCDEWDRVVALPRHKFVTGATLLQLIRR
jgi:hypothetical protein